MTRITSSRRPAPPAVRPRAPSSHEAAAARSFTFSTGIPRSRPSARSRSAKRAVGESRARWRSACCSAVSSEVHRQSLREDGRRCRPLRCSERGLPAQSVSGGRQEGARREARDDPSAGESEGALAPSLEESAKPPSEIKCDFGLPRAGHRGSSAALRRGSMGVNGVHHSPRACLERAPDRELVDHLRRLRPDDVRARSSPVFFVGDPLTKPSVSPAPPPLPLAVNGTCRRRARGRLPWPSPPSARRGDLGRSKYTRARCRSPRPRVLPGDRLRGDDALRHRCGRAAGAPAMSPIA